MDHLTFKHGKLGHVRFYLGVAAALLLSVPAEAQRQACSPCTIHLAPIATVGKASDSVLLGIGAKPYLLSNRRILILNNGTSLLEFSPTGSLTTTRGRRGMGPGELSGRGTAVLAPGDTLFVLQRERLELFTPAGRHVRSVNVTSPLLGGPFEVLRSGHIVMNGPRGNGSDFLHSMRTDGRSLRSFGGAALSADECTMLCRVRLLSRADAANEFFAISPEHYRIEHWTVDGQLRKVFAISSPWLNERGPNTGAKVTSGGRAPPPATITGISFDQSDKVIWISGRTPNARWKPPAPGADAVVMVGGRAVIGTRGSSRGGGSVAGLTLTNTDADVGGFDSVIDAVDANTGRVIATTRLPDQFAYVMPGGNAFTWREDADGVLSIVIWKLQVVAATR